MATNSPQSGASVHHIARPPWTRTALVAAALVLVTLASLGRSVWEEFEFIHFDDPLYVTRNEQVQRGLTLDNVRWAFAPDTVVAANWHPLTLVSHMMDCEIFGLSRPWGHHLTSLLLHAANVVLLLILLVRMTGQLWPSALVAALFAWHPLRVESVIWVSERKDVLSTFFWLLTMSAYVGYARSGGVWRYALVACWLLLGLLSKPMVVTLPLVLLLLDYWPLGRTPGEPWFSPPGRRRLTRLVLEKVPLLLLVVLFSAATLAAQRRGGAVASLEDVTLVARTFNVIWSYNGYIEKLLWPVDLAVYYPIQHRALRLVTALLGLAGLLLVSLLAVSVGRRWRYVPVGWFWYAGTLVPVVGLVQVGSAAMADRYTYVPMVGIFIIIAWGLRDAAAARPAMRPLIVGGVLAALALLAGATYRQVGHWRDTVRLFEHTIAVTGPSYVAYSTLGAGYLDRGDYDRALEAYEEAHRIIPTHPNPWFNKAAVSFRQSRWEEAITRLEEAVRLGYPHPQAYTQMARAYLELDRPEEAAEAYRQALQRDPHDATVLLALGRLEQQAGRLEVAIDLYRRAIEALPDAVEPRLELARILATAHDPRLRSGAQAVALARPICLKAPHPRAWWFDVLGMAFAENDRYDDAYDAASRAWRLAMENDDRDLARSIEQRMVLYLGGEPYREGPPADVSVADERPVEEASPLDRLLRGLGEPDEDAPP